MDDLIKNSRDVEFKKLGDFLHYIQPTKYIVNSTNYSNDFNTPVLTAGKSFILGYTNEDSNIYIASKQKPVIIFDDFTSSFKWVDFPFKIKSSAAKIIIPRNIDVNIRFFYYLMSNLKYTPSSHSRQWIAKYSKIIVPVPSIKEQERIVKILDKLTELTADLTAELTASIKQYEYYKNFLFSSISNLKLVNLHDLAILSNVGVDKKINDDEKSIKLLNYMDIFLNKYIDSKIPKMVVTASDKKIEVCDVKKGDIFITPSSEKINEIGLTSVITEDLKNCCYSYHIMRIRLKKENYLLSQYINYYFTSNIAKKQILKKAKGITRYGLTKTNFENIKIFIPSVQQQEIIIKTLDKFESLTSNLREGLPKEIQLQNKRYEYYRNKLLKFEGNN